MFGRTCGSAIKRKEETVKSLEAFFQFLILVAYFIATFWKGILWSIAILGVIALLYMTFGKIVLWITGTIVIAVAMIVCGIAWLLFTAYAQG